jgi:hypothetical protein
MDIKTQIQEQTNKLIIESSFIEQNPRYANFLLELCKLVDDYGHVPSSAIIGKHIKMTTRAVKYIREILHERDLWPFPPNAYRKHTKPRRRGRDYDAGLADQRYKEDVARVAAARRAKQAKAGMVLNNEDIEAHL